jgi:hypothetical protein
MTVVATSEFGIGVLGGLSQDGEGVVCAAVQVTHDNAQCLVDGGTGNQGGA